jgi:hypothetical protein
LHRQVLRELRPVGFVFLKKFVAKSGRSQIERHRNVIGLMVLEELPQRADENVYGFGGHPAGRSECHLHRRKEGAKNQRHGINEKKLMGGLGQTILLALTYMSFSFYSNRGSVHWTLRWSVD